MCYNLAYIDYEFAKYRPRYEDILRNSFPEFPEERQFSYFVNCFTYPHLPFIREGELTFYEWGLIPSYIKTKTDAIALRKKFPLFNAIGEEIFEKRSYKDAIKTQRGILPVNGFVEFRDCAKKKYPYFIRLKEEKILSLGCIYNDWVDKENGEVIKTFSIVTTEGNSMMKKIHNLKERMPLIIPKEKEGEWLDETLSEVQIKELIKPLDEKLMEAHTISTDANGGKNRNRNREDIFNPVEYPELTII